jgi:drug/metabolite transporter superfamily protein YnfA
MLEFIELALLWYSRIDRTMPDLADHPGMNITTNKNTAEQCSRGADVVNPG